MNTLSEGWISITSQDNNIGANTERKKKKNQETIQGNPFGFFCSKLITRNYPFEGCCERIVLWVSHRKERSCMHELAWDCTIFQGKPRKQIQVVSHCASCCWTISVRIRRIPSFFAFSLSQVVVVLVECLLLPKNSFTFEILFF